MQKLKLQFLFLGLLATEIRMLFGMDSETSSDECLEALAEDERQVLALPKVGRPLPHLEPGQTLGRIK